MFQSIAKMTKRAPLPPKGNPALYKKAVDLHQKAYQKEVWNKEKYGKKTGYMLQMIFGKGVWTLKDLDDVQLLRIIELAEYKLKK